MTTQANPIPQSVEDVAAQIRALNEPLVAASRKAANSSLDAYEQAVEQVIAFEKKVAGTAELDWLQGVVEAREAVARTLTEAYVSAVRELLN
jgi:hypothetical protein